MSLWFNLSAVHDESIFETAPHHYRYEMNLPVSADEVWAGLVADRPLAWCKALDGHYTSPRPFDVGTTRAVGVTANLLKLRERFFIWDEANRHHAFFVEQTNLPLFGLFAESYKVTPTADGCLFVWQFAFEARKGLGLAVALSEFATKKVLFDGFIRDTEKHFKAKVSAI